MTLLLKQQPSIMSSNLNHLKHSGDSVASSSVVQSALVTGAGTLAGPPPPAAPPASARGAALAGNQSFKTESHQQQSSCDVFLSSFLTQLFGVSQTGTPRSATETTKVGMNAAGQKKLDVHGTKATGPDSVPGTSGLTYQIQKNMKNELFNHSGSKHDSAVANISGLATPPRQKKVTSGSNAADNLIASGFLNARKNMSAQEFSLLSPSSF